MARRRRGRDVGAGGRGGRRPRRRMGRKRLDERQQTQARRHAPAPICASCNSTPTRTAVSPAPKSMPASPRSSPAPTPMPTASSTPLEFQKFNDARRAERKARLDAWRAKSRHRRHATPALRSRPRRPRPESRYADWNLDGIISPEEFAAKTRSQAMRADRNGDGVIVMEELRKGKGKKEPKPSNQN